MFVVACYTFHKFSFLEYVHHNQDTRYYWLTYIFKIYFRKRFHGSALCADE